MSSHKPKKEYVLRRLKELEEFHREDDLKIERIRDLAEFKDEVGLPSDQRFADITVRDPTIAAEIQRKAAQLALNFPKCRILPETIGNQEQDENAHLREKAYQEILLEAGSRLPGPDTFERICDAVPGDGGAWHKFLYAPDVWWERYSLKLDDYKDDDDKDEKTEGGERSEPSKKSKYERYNEDTERAKHKAGIPFYWLCCDAKGVYPSFAGAELSEIIEVTERNTSEIMREYGIGWDSGAQKFTSTGIEPGQAPQTVDGSGPPKTIKHIEYWNKKYCQIVIVGGNVEHELEAWEHGLKRPPYFFAPGLTRNYHHGRKIGTSISESKAWLVAYKSFMMTLHAQTAALQSYPIFFRTRPETGEILLGMDGRPIRMSMYKLGHIIEGLPGENLQPLAWPNIGQSFRDQLSMVSAMVASLEGPRVNPEVGKGVEGAGFAMTTQIAELRIADAPLEKHIQRSLTELTRFIDYLIEHVVEEDIYIHPSTGGEWLKIGPKDVKPPIRVEWMLDPERSAAKLVESRYLTELVKAGRLSQSQAIEQEGRDPVEVRFQIALDEIRMSEEYKKLRNERVFQQIGRGDVMQEALELAKRAIQGGPNPNPGAALPTPPTPQLSSSGAATGGPPILPTLGSRMIPDQGNLAQAPGGRGVASRGVPAPTSRPPALSRPALPRPPTPSPRGPTVPMRSAAPLARL